MTVWAGTGTREAIGKRGLRGKGDVLWCPHDCSSDGWRAAPHGREQ